MRVRVRLRDGLARARRCTCSDDRMRGAVATSAARGDLTIVAGADALTEYRFNTGTARHWFCGIYTHPGRRSNPDQLGLNIACLGISPFDLPEVPALDGVAQPADAGRHAALRPGSGRNRRSRGMETRTLSSSCGTRRG